MDGISIQRPTDGNFRSWRRLPATWDGLTATLPTRRCRTATDLWTPTSRRSIEPPRRGDQFAGGAHLPG